MRLDRPRAAPTLSVKPSTPPVVLSPPALRIVRATGKAMSVRDIALAALATKGNRHPDRHALKLTRKRLSLTMAGPGKRGTVRAVGSGKVGKRDLARQCVGARECEAGAVS